MLRSLQISGSNEFDPFVTLQAPLVPSSDVEQQQQQQQSAAGQGSGLVWMYVTRDGGLAYSWQVEGVGPDPSVALVLGNSPKVIQHLNASSPQQNPTGGLLDKLP